jgi:hypothetical protein
VAAWLDLMALVGTDPSVPWRSVVTGRGSSNTVAVADLVPSADAEARESSARTCLALAVDCYRRGMTEPLPLFPSFSYEVHRGRQSRKLWRTFGGLGDGDDEAVTLTFGHPDFDTVMSWPPRPGDPPGGAGRVARFARYLWAAVEGSTKEFGAPAEEPPAEQLGEPA